MQLHGQPLGKPLTHPFVLPRADGSLLTFLLAPLPLGFHQRLRQRGLQPPAPPVRIARDSSGKPLRDASGQAVTLTDARHPEYQAELERYHQRVAVLAVATALESDPNISFDTLPPASSDAGTQAWSQFADALFDELERAGFTAGDLILLCQEICRISNLLDDHLMAAQANFSLPPASGST